MSASSNIPREVQIRVLEGLTRELDFLEAGDGTIPLRISPEHPVEGLDESEESVIDPTEYTGNGDYEEEIYAWEHDWNQNIL